MPQSDAQCPTPPANRPVGTRGRGGAALRDPTGAIIALDVRSRALQAPTEARAPSPRSAGQGDRAVEAMVRRGTVALGQGFARQVAGRISRRLP